MGGLFQKYSSKSKINVLFGNFTALIITIFLVNDIHKIIKFADRGFDLTDESFYTLSYATRDEVGRSFTGATWLVGSVYDLLNQNIVWLRIFKLISLLLVGGFIGWQLFEWIYSFKKETYTSLKVQLWGWKSTLILGSALATLTPYSWAPATLNYNDVNLIVLLLIAGISISMLKKRSHNILLKSELIRFVVLGFLLGAGTFNKISSAVATLLLITPVIFFYFFDIKSILSNITALFGGFFLFWVFVHLFLVNIFSAVPKSLSLLKIIASDLGSTC